METEANYYVSLLHFRFLGLRWTCAYSGYIHLREWAFFEWWLCELPYPVNVKFGLRHSGFVLKWNILCFWESIENVLDLFFVTWYQWVRTNLGADSPKDLSYTFWEIRETGHKTKMIIKACHFRADELSRVQCKQPFFYWLYIAKNAKF
jgi:hypothetical protein